MKNTFYTENDFERLRKSSRVDYRTPFQIDRDRIIHSSEFRRLQGKTQVFLPGESDYYRTRLTHSIEVAQIGRSICNYLMNFKGSPFNPNFYIDPDLVESACLAHDLGHPPFGHAGERTLHKLMKPYGGFEGNAQTLRLVTETFYRDENKRRGMNPTRAFIDSILKYKTLYDELNPADNHFIYEYQKRYLDFVFEKQLKQIATISNEELNNLRSIECQIMDWADDTAYAINDIVDSISGGFINIKKLLDWKSQMINLGSEYDLNLIDKIIEWIRNSNYKAKFGSQIGDFILACSIEETNSNLSDYTNRYSYKLHINEGFRQKANLYKIISSDLVFNSSQLHQIEFKGDIMLSRMFSVMEENYIKNIKPKKLLSDFADKLIRREKDELIRARLICDYLSGMTDAYAMRTYKRLFDPDYSSLNDII